MSTTRIGVRMNNVKATTCTYCGEQTTDVAVSGQRCINKNSSALYRRIQLRKETSVNLTEFPTPDSVFYRLNTF